MVKRFYSENIPWIAIDALQQVDFSMDFTP
jgi:hypothetical protein